MPEPPKNIPTEGQSVHAGYQELLAKAEAHQPGITDLLILYGQMQRGLEQSQAYLRMYQTTYVSSSSSSTI
jgi:hypothetical protein